MYYTSDFDEIRNYDEFFAMSDDEILEQLQKKYPERELYGFKLGWREGRQYIFKARGVFGDVLIGWE